MTKTRGRIRQAIHSVNVRAIPLLSSLNGAPFTIHGVEEYGLIGDAPKNYVVFNLGADDDALAFIAKKPRKEGPIECVTEYLISRIGAQLPLRVAEGWLAVLPTRRGDEPDVRFLSRQFLKRSAGEQLVHGSQLVARCFEVKEQDLSAQIGRTKEWQFYTVNLVDEILGVTAGSTDRHARLREGFARMMAFDSIIGANDRHAQNWGVIQSAVSPDPLRFSPIYDTARGLFWNHREEKLEYMNERERDEAIARYAHGSTPLIGIEGERRPDHFDVIAFMARKGSPFRRPVVQIHPSVLLG